MTIRIRDYVEPHMYVNPVGGAKATLTEALSSLPFAELKPKLSFWRKLLNLFK